jgi:DNA ligase-1
VKRLAEALELTRATRSRLGKERALADAIAAMARMPGDEDGLGLATGTRLAAGRILAIGDGRQLGVGHSLMSEVVMGHTGFDREVLWACARKTGDLGEAFGLLVARIPGADQRPGVDLRELAATFDALAASGNKLAKRRRLDALFARATPLETKYLSKVMMGSLRTGALEGVLEGAIARAFDLPLEETRRAAALVTDPGALAVLARDRRLHEARMQLGRPIAFMLATPIETIGSPIDPALHVVEDKIDGVRAQIHKVGPEVSIFARGLERVTAAFPEVVASFETMPGSFALDGELVPFSPDGRPRPFQALQARLRRKEPTPALVAETPVTFVAYDLLAEDEEDLLALPWIERRARLQAFADERAAHGHFVLNACAPIAQGETPLAERLDVEFTAARARGHEGLVLKRVDAAYEAGRRGQAWIKVKRAFATLDVVITAAEEGHGRRAGVLSDYTFGVWREIPDSDAGERALVNVGKAYSGLTDEEIDAMTRRLERMTTGRFGGVRIVRPEIVLEVAFDGVQPSTRHKSGFALRFPRIVRIRDDKKPEDADTLEGVEALFRSQVDTGHRELVEPQAEAKPAVRNKTASKRAPVKEQLGLFDAPPKKG